MNGRVVFEADQNAVFRKPPVRSAEHKLVERGIAHTLLSARALMLVLAVCFLGATFYLIASSIPETPQLGKDILRPGEKVPLHKGL